MDHNQTVFKGTPQVFSWNWTYLTWGQLIAIILTTTFVFRVYMPSWDGVTAPLVGYGSWAEPALSVRMRFAKGALQMINNGYEKYKNSMYKVLRNDRDILVLSNKYAEELRNLPSERLNSIKALVRNFGGRYGGIELLVESDIGTRAIQTKVTPNLAKLTDDMRDELEYALTHDLPVMEDWTSIPLLPVMVKIIARMSNRAFVGFPVCRNEKWLDAAAGFSHHVTMVQMTLRAFPPFFRPFLDFFLPSSWKYRACIRQGKKILAPEIRQRRFRETTDPNYEKPQDLLQAMMDLSTPGQKDSDPEDLAYRQLVMSLAAVHTTGSALAQVIFDLAARPEYFDILREEVNQIVAEDGEGWGKQSLNKMRKMDSFFRESQRFNPPSLLSFHRIVDDPEGIKLHDGIHLPHRAHICLPSYAISKDPNVIENADEFDGLRYYHLRKNPKETMKHQHAMTDKNHMHFGYGKYSCPGRFFASNEMKMILATILLRYEARYPEGASRPANMNIDEFMFVFPETPLLMKRMG
ncbi:cytochrome P450 [Aspergillus ruber CBS 135680]|uniref:p450 monooxygenase n=1 Tax=Aspergillus ruber (strain CBS 135680) TaxID=1388766 RepID=A0A017S4X6_ASPRC|nr:P450 monooxygenase [Aspergillus ruber CBS 135680]EYE91684.1 P450 monooxygenase [Aspergillus ruber CBS 135680]